MTHASNWVILGPCKGKLFTEENFMPAKKKAKKKKKH
jgi:hypothetical protein